jgi:His-Xaa-Ser system radical SAM maturase HxsC
MKLVTAGVPLNLTRPVVGIVSTQPIPEASSRHKAVLVCADLDGKELDGYRAVLTTCDVGTRHSRFPVLHRMREIDHLKDGFIVAVEPSSGFVRTVYRPDSEHNILFATERCNSNCLMCSQPPQDRDDADALTARNLEIIDLMQPTPDYLCITGGEPTLLGERLFRLISALRDKLPMTTVHMLSNGRLFAWAEFTQAFAEVSHRNLSVGIPLYSDVAAEHDYVVQSKGAFDQTLMGLHQLARWGQRVEVRVVLHALTVPRMARLAEFIYRNLTFTEHIALMGLETIGYTPRNFQKLWIDPWDYQTELREAVEILRLRGMSVSIYNHQLCVLDRSLWKFARRSISDWKNIYLDDCTACGVRNQCGGFFQWATKLHSAHIHPLSNVNEAGKCAR